MTTKQDTPILTRVLYVSGVVTIIAAVIGGGVICAAELLREGIAVIIGGIFAGIIYIGIGQAVDYLARSAHSTERICTILETSITERLLAIGKIPTRHQLHRQLLLVPKWDIIIRPMDNNRDQLMQAI